MSHPTPEIRQDSYPQGILREQDEFAKNDPVTLNEFDSGKGWSNAEFRGVDYTIRDDYQAKLGSDKTSKNYDQLEGYSIKGLTEAMIAELMNPELGRRAAELESEGKNLPEIDYELNKTLDLLKEKINAAWPGMYDFMIRGFSRRMENLIYQANGGYNRISRPGEDGRIYTHPILLYSDAQRFADNYDLGIHNPKIVTGRFKAWVPNDRDMDTWFHLSNMHHMANWREIRDEITVELAQETAKQ